MEHQYPGNERGTDDEGARREGLGVGIQSSVVDPGSAASVHSPQTPSAAQPPTIGGETAGTAGETIAGSGGDEQIMSKLPRARPQRRSTRRPKASASSNAKRSSARSGTRKARSAAAERQRGLPEQAVGAAVTVATLPVKATVSIAKRTGDLLGRLR